MLGILSYILLLCLSHQKFTTTCDVFTMLLVCTRNPNWHSQNWTPPAWVDLFFSFLPFYPLYHKINWNSSPVCSSVFTHFYFLCSFFFSFDSTVLTPRLSASWLFGMWRWRGAKQQRRRKNPEKCFWLYLSCDRSDTRHRANTIY